MALDIDSLWDFGNPALSEQRFREALDSATSDQRFLLQTQIARTYSMRKEFGTARTILSKIEMDISDAHPEVQVRYRLELGRSYVSGAHPEKSIAAESIEIARTLYQDAFGTAKAAGLDGLAVDALHMMAFVDTQPVDQLVWARKALAIVKSSNQLDAKKWEASLLNNIGYALHRLDQYEEALVEFKKALQVRERGSDQWATHVARWMVAWTLRALGRTSDALEIQLRLERERDAVGEPDQSVYEELERLYRLIGDHERADRYAQKSGQTPT